MISSIFSFRAHSAIVGKSVMESETLVPTDEVPALPGTIKRLSHFGL